MLPLKSTTETTPPSPEIAILPSDKFIALVKSIFHTIIIIFKFKFITLCWTAVIILPDIPIKIRSLLEINKEDHRDPVYPVSNIDQLSPWSERMIK